MHVEHAEGDVHVEQPEPQAVKKKEKERVYETWLQGANNKHNHHLTRGPDNWHNNQLKSGQSDVVAQQMCTWKPSAARKK